MSFSTLSFSRGTSVATGVGAATKGAAAMATEEYCFLGFGFSARLDVCARAPRCRGVPLFLERSM